MDEGLFVAGQGEIPKNGGNLRSTGGRFYWSGRL